MRSWLARIAGGAEIPVFPVVGGGYTSAIHRLRLTDGIRIVTSPRHASVLLVAGTVSPEAMPSVSHVHDQMAGPRVTIGWGHPEPSVVPTVENVVGDASDVAEAIRLHFRAMLAGDLTPEPPLLPNVDAVEWRGVGPYGHGGAGMTGGTPYGRPLALRAKDRDGLELDQLPVTVGPWFNGFPPGLALRVSLQGDVAQTIEVVTTTIVSGGTPDIFTRALHEPVPVRDLEMARATRHVEWIADTLRIAGVDRLAHRADLLAASIEPGDVARVDRLTTSARRSLLRRMSLGGVGLLPTDSDLAGLGPVARAAGADDDLRTGEQSYRDIGFAPVRHEGGDAWARFIQRAAEASQAVEVAQAAGDRLAFGDGQVEAPDGLHTVDGDLPADRTLAMLEDLLAGMEWGDLVTTVQSLGIDMESVSVDSEAV